MPHRRRCFARSTLGAPAGCNGNATEAMPRTPSFTTCSAARGPSVSTTDLRPRRAAGLAAACGPLRWLPERQHVPRPASPPAWSPAPCMETGSAVLRDWLPLARRPMTRCRRAACPPRHRARRHTVIARPPALGAAQRPQCRRVAAGKAILGRHDLIRWTKALGWCGGLRQGRQLRCCRETPTTSAIRFAADLEAISVKVSKGRTRGPVRLVMTPKLPLKSD